MCVCTAVGRQENFSLGSAQDSIQAPQLEEFTWHRKAPHYRVLVFQTLCMMQGVRRNSGAGIGPEKKEHKKMKYANN